MSERIEIPKYVKIAVDVAIRIYKGQLAEGDKLRGRSLLASEYNVSPETIRRAMKILEDTDVVKVNKGSGIIVKSREKAYQFVENFKDKENISILRGNIKKLLQQRKAIEKEIQDINEKIIDYSYRFKNISLIDPIEILITSGSHLIGKTTGGTQFWHKTGGTIIGVKRDNTILLSPGPYLEFKENDRIMVVGDLGVFDRVSNYINTSE